MANSSDDTAHLGKQPVQASGGGSDARHHGDADELVPDAKAEGAGESAGGAYPNPNTGKDGSDNAPGDLLGHGGQSKQAYHGSGQLGDQKVGDQPNAGARDD